jgi:hypothetical protein
VAFWAMLAGGKHDEEDYQGASSSDRLAAPRTAVRRSIGPLSQAPPANNVMTTITCGPC